MAVDCGEGVIVGGELNLALKEEWMFCSSRADGGLPNGLVTTIGGTEIGSSLASHTSLASFSQHYFFWYTFSVSWQNRCHGRIAIAQHRRDIAILRFLPNFSGNRCFIRGYKLISALTIEHIVV